MKQLLTSFFAIAIMAFMQLSCNPNCKSLVNLETSTTINPAGFEILLTATPLNDLENRKVFFDDVEAKTRFEPGFGLVVEVPSGTSSDVEIKIEDPDCLDVQSLPFHVVDPNFLVGNMDFVPPTPPDIIIPEVPINFPGNVDNAWLSPDNPEYCLWFIMYRAKNPITGLVEQTNLINPDSSFEQATCACLRDFNFSHLPYAQNRMGGIVNKATNTIEIYIDRTSVGGEIEHFSGKFIDIDQTPYANNLGVVTCPPPTPPATSCGPQNGLPQTSRHLMLLTSQTTGRQLVAFQLTGF